MQIPIQNPLKTDLSKQNDGLHTMITSVITHVSFSNHRSLPFLSSSRRARRA